MEERRTNILIGDEVLRQIDDSKNVTHANGVMTVELTEMPNPAQIGGHKLRSANGLFMLYNADETWASRIATMDDLSTLQPPDLSGYAPITHTHPEYEGTGTTTTDSGARWRIRNFTTPTLVELPADAWNAGTLTIKMIARITTSYSTSFPYFFRLADMGNANTLLRCKRTSTTLFQMMVNNVILSPSATFTSAVTLPEHLPIEFIFGGGNLTLTVKGETYTVAQEKPAVTGSTFGVYLAMGTPNPWYALTSFALWTGDPALTAPNLWYDAEHIENSVMINMAARKNSAGANDLTLTSPLVIYTE